MHVYFSPVSYIVTVYNNMFLSRKCDVCYCRSSYICLYTEYTRCWIFLWSSSNEDIARQKSRRS